jgi:hypothetical protein
MQQEGPFSLTGTAHTYFGELLNVEEEEAPELMQPWVLTLQEYEPAQFDGHAGLFLRWFY